MQLNNLSVKRETMLHKDNSWVQVGQESYKKKKKKIMRLGWHAGEWTKELYICQWY